MKALKQSLRSFATWLPGVMLGALVFWLTATWIESWWIARSVPNMPGWTVWLSPGATAPLLFIGVFGALLIRVTRRWIPDASSPRALVEGSWRWLRDGEPEQLAWRTARLLGGITLFGVWGYIGVEAGNFIQADIQTPTFASALFIMLLIVAALGVLTCSSLVIGPLGRALAWVARKGLWGARLTQPMSAALALASVGAWVSWVAWSRYEETLVLLPWSFVLAPGIGGLLAGVAVWGLKTRRVARNIVVVALTLTCIASGVWVFFYPQSGERCAG